MCYGFGIIISNDLRAWWCEPDGTEGNCSHSRILMRLDDLNPNWLRDGQFVRTQFPTWTPDSFEFDDLFDVPEWALRNEYNIIQMSKWVLSKTLPIWNKYKHQINKGSETYHDEITKQHGQFDPEWNLLFNNMTAREIADLHNPYSAKNRMTKQMAKLPGYVPMNVTETQYLELGAEYCEKLGFINRNNWLNDVCQLSLNDYNYLNA
ncbi:MAG: hypothetical protein PHU53_07240 [Thermoplasmata archaeon]|nr:hypothetical protein [Thermoplasmata archaeon]